MSSGLTGIADRFRGRTIAREEMKEQPTNGQRHCGIGRSLPRYPVIERKTRRTRRNRKRGGKEERKRNGSQLWLPTAIRGGRHESHDDVTATMATSRRGQYVFLPSVPFPRLVLNRIIDAASPRTQATRRCIECRGEEREKRG